MKTCKLIFLVFLFSAFSALKGQNINSFYLRGYWSMDWGKNALYLEFLNDSVYKYSTLEFDSSARLDFYKFLKDKEEFVIELYMYTGTYIASVKTFLIRKIDTVSYMLQNPLRNQLGEIISYKWQKTNKTNTFYLYRLERRQLITE